MGATGSIIMMLLFGGAALGYFLWMKKARAKMVADMAHFTASQVAAKLGLRQTAGSPDGNLVLPPQSMGQAKYDDDGVFEYHMRLEGRPRGRDVVVEHYEHHKVDAGLTGTTITYGSNVGISVRTAYPGQAEITSRKGTFAPARKLALPVHSLGDPLLDQEFVFAATDASLGPRIAEALHALDANYRASGARIEISGCWVSATCDRQAAGGLMAQAEVIIPALELLAQSLDGLPAGAVIEFVAVA